MNHFSAGLTNSMFLPASSLVVEVTSKLDSVSMPLCGYYGPFGAIFGHHHYVYSYDRDQQEKMDRNRTTEIAQLVHDFYIQLHMKVTVG